MVDEEVVTERQGSVMSELSLDDDHADIYDEQEEVKTGTVRFYSLSSKKLNLMTMAVGDRMCSSFVYDQGCLINAAQLPEFDLYYRTDVQKAKIAASFVVVQTCNSVV